VLGFLITAGLCEIISEVFHGSNSAVLRNGSKLFGTYGDIVSLCAANQIPNEQAIGQNMGVNVVTHTPATY
jgi:hypothetical protein